MLDLLIIPGMSVRNRDWTYAVQKLLAPDFLNTEVFTYQSWQDTQAEFNFASEYAKLQTYLSNYPRPYLILAKSIGAILSLKAIQEKVATPLACCLIGTAIVTARELQLSVEEWLKQYQTTTVFLQKEHDPVVSAEELRELLIMSEATNYTFIAIPGSDHQYPDLEQIRKITFELASHF